MVAWKHVDYSQLEKLRGKSYSEIADLLGIPRNTVASRMHRLRQQMGLSPVDPQANVKRNERERMRRRSRALEQQAFAREVTRPEQKEVAAAAVSSSMPLPPPIETLETTETPEHPVLPPQQAPDEASVCSSSRMASTAGQADAPLPEPLEPVELEALPEAAMDFELAVDGVDDATSILDVDDVDAAEQESGEITGESKRQFHQSRGVMRNPARKKPVAGRGTIEPVLPPTPTKQQIYAFLSEAVRNTR